MRSSRCLWAALLGIASMASPVLATQSADSVVIGSKNFTESRLLGEMLALVLKEHTDLAVEHRSSLGGTKVCFDSLLEGEIDMYAEYSGTAWAVLLKETGKVTDPLQAFLHVQAASRAQFDVEWLQPFGFENTYAIALPRERAAELGVRSISDLARQEGLRAAFSIEFINREDGFKGLARHYGLDGLDARAMEHGLAYEALAGGAADVIDAYSTDGKLERYDLTVLEDDRHFFPPYHAAPVVRGEFLRAHPAARSALARLAFSTTGEEMIALNFAIEEERRDFEAVAREFLESKGVLGARQAEPEATDASMLAFFGKRWPKTLQLVWEHLQLTFAAVLLAALFAIPLGLLLARRPRLERLALGGAGIVQTIPSLALLAFMIPLPWFGLSVRSAIAALFMYAVLPILRNTLTGLREVDGDLIEAARGMGLSQRQVLWRIQLPLSVRTIMAGVRTATVISIGVATLAAFIGAGGLGQPIVEGLYLNNSALILAGALPAAGLALIADGALGVLERWVTPRGLRF